MMEETLYIRGCHILMKGRVSEIVWFGKKLKLTSSSGYND